MSIFLIIPENDYDKPVYRIISKERFIELFQKEENILVHPSRWDDPYENFILKSKVKMKSGEVKDFDFHENIYGQCWSRHKASDAMWRIYSPNKNGIGKVEYLTEPRLNKYANSIYVNSVLSMLFKAKLTKIIGSERVESRSSQVSDYSRRKRQLRTQIDNEES